MRSSIESIHPMAPGKNRVVAAVVVWRHRVQLGPAYALAGTIAALAATRHVLALAAAFWLLLLTAGIVLFRVGEWRSRRYEAQFKREIVRANAKLNAAKRSGNRTRVWWCKRRRQALKRRQPAWVYDRLTPEGHVDWPGKANVLASRTYQHAQKKGVMVLRGARCFTRERWAFWWERGRIPTAVLFRGRGVENKQHRRVRTFHGLVWLLVWRAPYALLLGWLYPPLRLVGRDRHSVEAGLAVALQQFEQAA